MLKKDFLLFLHTDWKRNVHQLHEEMNASSGSRAAHLERIRNADRWIALYAAKLREQYGVEA